VTIPFVDTDVIIRLVTGDDNEKQERALQLFQQVEAGTLTVAAPDTVIADAVYVLASPRLYGLSRTEVAEILGALVRLTHFRVENRAVVSEALRRYAATRHLDFGDAMILATMQGQGASVLYSYDTDFDRHPDFVRREP
jgi:predicted nucleic acid-binding protein